MQCRTPASAKNKDNDAKSVSGALRNLISEGSSSVNPCDLCVKRFFLREPEPARSEVEWVPFVVDALSSVQGDFLPVHLHRKLELPWIVRCCRLPRISEQRIHLRHIESICDVEHVGDQIQAHPFAEINSSRNPNIIEHRVRLHPGIAAKVAIQQKQC